MNRKCHKIRDIELKIATLICISISIPHTPYQNIILLVDSIEQTNKHKKKM